MSNAVKMRWQAEKGFLDLRKNIPPFFGFFPHLGQHLSQVGWYALRMVGQISGIGILKNYGNPFVACRNLPGEIL